MFGSVVLVAGLSCRGRFYDLVHSGPLVQDEIAMDPPVP